MRRSVARCCLLQAALAGGVPRAAVGRDPAGGKGEKHALIVGVRKYDPTQLQDLNYSEADATGLARVLKANGYRDANVVLMTQTVGADNLRFLPFAERIRAELKLLAEGCAEADSILVAFAGQGVQFRGTDDSYFCPADAKLDDRSTLISLGEVYGQLDKCPAGYKLLLVDACRNDPAVKNARSKDVVKLESVTRPQALAPPGGVVALFSCSSGERAVANDDLKHGVFFHYVIEALAGSAATEDTEGVTLDELALYVKRQVHDYARTKFGASQQPERVGRERGLVPLVSFGRETRLFNQGRFLLRRGDVDAAITALTRALALNPKMALALRERGSAHVARRDYASALADYDAAVRLGPPEATAFDLRGQARFKDHQDDAAIADYTEAIRLDPKHAPHHNTRGLAWKDKGEDDKSITDYDEAIRLNPKFQAAYRNRAIMHAKKGDEARAKADREAADRLKAEAH